MRLILKEYLETLKEKDELDFLICNLYESKGYILDSLPKTGNRQYGVDIQLHNEEELLLFVVKQGNINRKVWDGNVNSVRQSIGEIRDVAFPMMTSKELERKIRIIVATNGVLDETVKINWNGFVEQNKKWGETNISIEFFNIDCFVKEIEQDFFNEYIFDSDLRSLLRKALYFIDNDDDYNTIYYETIIDNLLNQIPDTIHNRKAEKLWMTSYMISQMIADYAGNAGHTKLAIMVTEYLIIRYWDIIREKGWFEKTEAVSRLVDINKRYEYWNNIYVNNIRKFVDGTAIIPFYNIIENRVLFYEMLGYLSAYANYLHDVNSVKLKEVTNIMVELINQYPGYFYYAPYDNSISTIIMLIRVLADQKRYSDIKTIMDVQLGTMCSYYRIFHKYPAPSDTYKEALEIESGESNLKYETSAFLGYYLLLIAELNNEDLYNTVYNYLNNDLKSVCKCAWFLKKEEEEYLYHKNAMFLSGEGVDIPVMDTFERFKERIGIITERYRDDIFSFQEYSFPSLEMIICRYYSYIPKVNYKDDSV